MTPTPTESERPVAVLLCRHPADGDEVAAGLSSCAVRVVRQTGLENGRELILAVRPDLVAVDLGEASGEEAERVCRRLAAACGRLAAAPPLLILAAEAALACAAGLRRAGADDVMIRPLDRAEFVRRVELALAARSAAPAGIADILEGRGAAVGRVIEQVRLVAAKNTTVLITGETGSGKERVARAIHALSPRSEREMVSVNCAGVPATLLEDEFFGHVRGAFTDARRARIGRFEQAQRSTLFLDEIGDLPLDLQPKLLRALQEREISRIGGVETRSVDVRVIAATNHDLWTQVGQREFREDLYYRLNVFPIHVPPLRERREDIPVFIDLFLEKFCRRDALPLKRIDAAAEAELTARQWPGNIRELENAVEMAVIRSEQRRRVILADFPAPRRPAAAPHETSLGEAPADFRAIVERFERELIGRALECTAGNKTRAAEALRIKRTTLVEKIKKFDRERARPISRSA